MRPAKLKPPGRDARAREATSVERVMRELRGRIGRGLLLPGEQIRQEEMAEAFGVSRIPLREALNILADQGLVEHHPNRGYFVAKRASEELHQLFRMLEFLERELCRSMEWPSKAELRELRKLNQAMAELVGAADWSPILAHNHAFHFLIFGLSHYRLILREVERLWGMTDVYVAGKLALEEARVRTVEEHEQIVAALERHDHGGYFTLLDQHRASAPMALPTLRVVPAGR